MTATAADAYAWAAALLSPWGFTSTCGDVTDSAVTDWLDSGAVALTGTAEGPPIVPPGAAATAARGAEVAFASLAPTRPRGWWHRWFGARAALSELGRRGPCSVGGACRAVATSDGWVVISLARPDDVGAVAAIVQSGRAVDEAEAAWSLLDQWASAVRTAEVVERVSLLGVPVGAVPERGGWHARDDLAAGVPASVVHVTELAGSPARHDAPLVVDLSALWAGPLCAKLLSSAGARVVKVEFAERLDGARCGNEAFYDLLHSGHDSVVLEPKARDDRRLLEQLLMAADVVIEASRPRALLALGVDAHDVCSRSPTTWVSLTAYGRTAPDRVGFGDDVAMAAGLVAWDVASGVPMPCGDALADPLTGMHAAVAAMASHRCGGSRLLDIAMCDVVASTLAWMPREAVAATASDAGWVVDTDAGPRMVSPPHAPSIVPRAAAAGRDTQVWRERLGA